MRALRTLGSVGVGLAPVLTVAKKPFDRTSFGNRQVLEVEGIEITHIVLIKMVNDGCDSLVFEVRCFGPMEQWALGARGACTFLSLAHKRRANLLRKIGWENTIQGRVGVVKLKHTTIG